MASRRALHTLRTLRKPHPSSATTITTTTSSTPSEPAIPPGSSHHHDLPSFLAYAARTGLSPTTTLHVGTRYEYTVAAALRRLGFSLVRTGRTADRGIDLLGSWALPGRFLRPWRVLAQCKALGGRRAAGPDAVRALEGAFAGAPSRWRGRDEGGRGTTLALLASTRGATRGVREALARSAWGLGFVQVGGDGVVRQFVWNAVAEEMGLAGVGVTVRYREVGEGGGEEEGDEEEGGVRREIALTWEGRAIEDLEPPELEAREHRDVADGEDAAGESREMERRGDGAVASVVEEQAAGLMSEAAEDAPPKRKRGRPRRSMST